jgi:phage terminase large subunit GpA-like protein
MAILTPPPNLSVSQWADANRRLSPEASAEPGSWSTARAEYQRGIMDAVTDPAVANIVVMSSAQIGKTEICNNVLGYHIDQDPSPILVVQPTLDMAQAWSKDRLAPMLRDTPVLQGKVADPRSRDSGNTTLHKVFPGGHITACGANSPSSLASRPIRIVLCDEVDRYPVSAGAEGDPISLARKRSATFWNKKLIMVSTPTVKGQSRIEAAFAESDQREYYVPCPDCAEFHTLKWANVQFDKEAPETAIYVCEACGSAWDDAKRLRAIRKGEWRAHAPFKGTAGFRLSALYSPWMSLEDGVRDFLEARKQPATLRVWINTYLGETWEEEGERVDDIGVSERREDYGETLPSGVLVVTAGIDVQDDRLEMEIVGWGRNDESWSLEYKTIYGDPSSAIVWTELDGMLRKTYFHERGVEIPIRAACVDSGGHHTQSVYAFCKAREGRRIFAIRGVGGEGKPLVGRPTINNAAKVKLFPIGVDTAKELVYSRLRITEPGPGYCHFPAGYDDEYFRQLTAEQLVSRYHKGFLRREWQKIRPRNEALDCRVYALAAYSLLNANMNLIADKIQSRPTVSEPEQTTEIQPTEKPLPIAQRPVRRSPQRGGFVNGWR